MTAFAQSLDTSNMAVGFSDGTVRLGRLLFVSEVLPVEATPAGLKKIDDRDSSDGSAIYSTITGNQIRKTSMKLELEDEIQASECGLPIVALDYRFTEFGERPKKRVAAVDSKGHATVVLVESKLNLFTRKLTSNTVKTQLPAIPEGNRISHVLVTGTGDDVYLAKADGKVHRYSMRDFEHPVLAETISVLPSGVDLTVSWFPSGRQVDGGRRVRWISNHILLDGKKGSGIKRRPFIGANEGFPTAQFCSYGICPKPTGQDICNLGCGRAGLASSWHQSKDAASPEFIPGQGTRGSYGARSTSQRVACRQV